MALVMEAVVAVNFPTKGGKWNRLVMATGRRVNDLVMVPAESVYAALDAGDKASIPVRASVETNPDGRPTKNIVYWLDDGSTGASESV